MRPAALLNTLVIAGVGLIGGSIGLGAKQRFLAEKVIGFDKNKDALETALKRGVIDEAYSETGDWLKKADLVILASPVKTLVKLAQGLEPYLGKNTVVTDVGSVKKEVVDALSHLRFVGSHPMAGSEKSGVAHADAALLENAVWVLTPGEDTDPATLALVREFITHLGARPIRTTPEQHDRLVAAVSHVPYLAAVALTQLIGNDVDRELMMLLAAGGYRDLTRIASGNPLMSRDMVLGNKYAVKETLEKLLAQLSELEQQLEHPETLLQTAEHTKEIRDSFPIVRRSLLPAKYEIVVAVQDKPGQLAIITGALGEASINIKDIEMLGIREAGGAVRLAFEDEPQYKRSIQTLRNIGYEVMTQN
ncbi:MAG: prephenate dehydrogenase [Trueperaceae bacterium]|nr:prephenate dehydrogenase [Trueperaceae bacterium]